MKTPQKDGPAPGPRRGIAAGPSSAPRTEAPRAAPAGGARAPSSSSPQPSRGPVAKGAPVIASKAGARPSSAHKPSTSTSAKGKAKKVEATPEDVAAVLDSYARGDMTLAEVLNVDDKQRLSLKETAFRQLGEGKRDAAIATLKGLAALDPYDLWVLSALGGAYLQGNDLDAAEPWLSRAIELFPSHTVARAHRGELRVLRGDVVGAKADLDVAIAGDARDPIVKRARAVREALERSATASDPGPARRR